MNIEKGKDWFIFRLRIFWLGLSLGWKWPYSSVWRHSWIALSWRGKIFREWKRKFQPIIPHGALGGLSRDDIAFYANVIEAGAKEWECSGPHPQAPFFRWMERRVNIEPSADGVGEFVVNGGWYFPDSDNRLPFLECNDRQKWRKFPDGYIPCAVCSRRYAGVAARIINGDRTFRVIESVCPVCRAVCRLKSEDTAGHVSEWYERVFIPFLLRCAIYHPAEKKRNEEERQQHAQWLLANKEKFLGLVHGG